MNGRLTATAARHMGRPLLLTPNAAHELIQRIQDIDARAFERPGRFGALLRRLSGNGSHSPALAMEDAGDYVPPRFGDMAAYAPLYINQPDDSGFCWTLKGGIALMNADTPLLDRGEEFCGVVYHGYDTLEAGMREALADDRVHAIFLRLDTPGGVATGGISALAEFMRGARAAAGGKPIWVYADMACSAGYWIAAQADRIVAPALGIVGSIGAVIVHEDLSGALEKYGMAVDTIEFPDGGKKTDGAWWKSLSDGARADLQAEIDQCGRAFLADVVAGRPNLTEAALAEMRAGVFLGLHDEAARSGEALGLVDSVMSEQAAFEALVAEVSTPASASKPQAQARAGRAAAETTEDNPMTTKTSEPGGRAAAAQGVQPSAQAAQPTVPEDETEPKNGTDPDESTEPMEAGRAAKSRVQAILTAPEAKGREALAQHFAFETEMPAASAIAALKAAPQATGGLATRMAAHDQAPGLEATKDTADERLVMGMQTELKRDGIAARH